MDTAVDLIRQRIKCYEGWRQADCIMSGNKGNEAVICWANLPQLSLQSVAFAKFLLAVRRVAVSVPCLGFTVHAPKA